MTGAELKTLTTSLLGDQEMDDTLFYTLLNLFKSHIEGMRPWRILLTEDGTQTVSPGNTYTTMKTIPAGFIQYDSRKPIRLLSASGAFKDLKPSSFSDRRINQNKDGLFYPDYRNSQFGIIGTIDQTYTVYQYFIKSSDDITSSTSWTFPARYHPLLAYFVSAAQKGGIDYDDIFARMAPENRATAELLLNNLENWDNNLQLLEANA